MNDISPEERAKYLANPMIHRFDLHSKSTFLLISLMVESLGINLMGRGLVWPLLEFYSFCFLQFSVLLAIVWSIKPCTCVSIVPTWKARIGILKARESKHKIGSLVAILMILLTLTVTLILQKSAHQSALDIALVILGGMLASGGFALLLASIFNWLPRGQFLMSKQEQHDLINLSGKNDEELERMGEIYMKAGSFDAADECSRKRLSLVEDKFET